MKRILVVLLALFLIVGCTSTPTNPIHHDEDGKKFMEEYESYNGQTNEDGVPHATLTIAEENPMVYATVEELNEVLKNGTGIIYLGFPECPWCRNTLPVFLDACGATIVQKVYYYNCLLERDLYEMEDGVAVKKEDGSEEYYHLIEEMEEWAEEYEGMNDSSIKRIYFPTYLFVKDGEIVAMQVSSLESVTDPRAPLTEEQYKELYDRFLSYINMVKGACDSKC